MTKSSVKIQAPEKHQTSNFKHGRAPVLVLGGWNFSGAWILVPGAFARAGLFRPQWLKAPSIHHKYSVVKFLANLHFLFIVRPVIQLLGALCVLGINSAYSGLV
jgi:hypothetical protein